MEHVTHNTKHNDDERNDEAYQTDDSKEEEKISDECHRKCGEIEKKYKRALADYQNLLKRTAADKEEFIKFANERLIEEILPVYDNLKVSLSHAGDLEKKNGWAEGIKHIVSQFKNILENIGVEEIKTASEKFDPNTMEAVKQEEAENEKQDGMVARELSAGYKLKGKVIRAARVAVYEFKK